MVPPPSSVRQCQPSVSPIVNAVLQAWEADLMMFCLVEPRCTTGALQEWAAPQPGSGMSPFYHILLTRTQVTTKEAGKYPLNSGEMTRRDLSGPLLPCLASQKLCIVISLYVTKYQPAATSGKKGLHGLTVVVHPELTSGVWQMLLHYDPPERKRYRLKLQRPAPMTSPFYQPGPTSSRLHPFKIAQVGEIRPQNMSL